MRMRSTFPLVALLWLAATACGNDELKFQHSDAPEMAADTVSPPPQIPGGAGSTLAAPAPPAATAPVPPAEAPAPAAPARPVIVDVRTQQEYDAGHVEGAILIPHDQMEQRWQELAQYRNQPMVLYCRSGRRSGLAIEVLKAKGFTHLENGGGIDAMAAKGYGVIK